MTWGADEQLTHASDARLRGALAAGFDPWTDERRRVRSRAPGYTELLEIRPAKAGREPPLPNLGNATWPHCIHAEP